MEKIIKVPDMHCENCVRRIREDFEGLKIDVKINLAEQTVTVLSEEDYIAAFDELYDLGFSPEKL